MQIPLVDLKQQYQVIKSEVQEAIKRILESSAFVLGKEVELFEEEFAEYCGANYAVGVGSGTEALQLALLACGIGKGDEVITTANTFVATVGAIHLTGARPVLADVNPNNYNLDFNYLEKAINEKTKAVIPVHLHGQSVDMDKLIEIANAHHLLIIEDACQAHGAEYKKKKVGSFGQAGAFSFYPGKNLGAYGDGGAIVTNKKEVSEKIRMLRHHGQKQKYFHEIKGFNSRLDAIQAAILRVKLKYLDNWNKARNHWAQIYTELLKETSLITPEVEPWTYHIFHHYIVRCQRRDEMLNFLKKRGIYADIHYPIPIHLLEAFKDLGHKKGDFPVAEQMAEEILSLPIFPELTKENIDYIVNTIKEFEGL